MDFVKLENQLHIAFDENTKYDMQKYVELFKEYNSHTNLVSKNDENLLFEKHIYDSLSMNLFFEKYEYPKTIFDIGTGGGFPSIPLVFLLKNTKITAIDSINKKIRFLKEIKEQFGFDNFNPICGRIEEQVKEKSGYDVVTSRALGELPMLLEYAIPFLKVGGYFVAYKSQNSDEELKKAENAMKVLNTKLIDTIEYKLPLKENFERKLLVFQKVGNCLNIYPRQNGLIKKSPL